MSKYWAKRAAEQSRKQYDKSLAELEKELSRYYKIALDSVEYDIVSLYTKILLEMKDNENVGADALYRFDRFTKLRDKIVKQLNKLGFSEIEAMSASYSDLSRYISNFIADEAKGTINRDFLILDNEKVKEILNSIWCADGKHWSERVWDNTKKLQASIEKGLIDSVVRGASKDELVKELQSSFGVSFSNADRIARTELAYIQNKTTCESYKKAGIQYVETIVAEDERLCEICGKNNGKITPISDAKAGTAFLFHPNCRCNIIPVL